MVIDRHVPFRLSGSRQHAPRRCQSPLRVCAEAPPNPQQSVRGFIRVHSIYFINTQPHYSGKSGGSWRASAGIAYPRWLVNIQACEPATNRLGAAPETAPKALANFKANHSTIPYFMLYLAHLLGNYQF